MLLDALRVCAGVSSGYGEGGGEQDVACSHPVRRERSRVGCRLLEAHVMHMSKVHMEEYVWQSTHSPANSPMNSRAQCEWTFRLALRSARIAGRVSGVAPLGTDDSASGRVGTTSNRQNRREW